MSAELIKRNFKSHKIDDTQKSQINNIEIKFIGLAEQIEYSCPNSRERSIAITKLEEVKFWATAAISRPRLEGGGKE